jgi:hypothetical protein
MSNPALVSPDRPLPDSLTELGNEINLLESRLLALKRKRNSMMTICRIPSDVLVRILHQLRMIVDESLKFRKDEGDVVSECWLEPGFRDFHCNPAWIRMTFICTHIRGLALEIPELWTSIDVRRHESLVALYISRAKGLPLIVNFDRTTTAQIWASKRSGFYLKQAKALRTVAGNKRPLGLLLECAPPTLSTLHVSDVMGNKETVELHRLGPHLEELYMYHGYITNWPQDGPVWESLSRLRLYDTRIAPSVVLPMLCRTPCLETLVVSTKNPDRDHVRHDPIHKSELGLTRLKHVSISTHPTLTLVYMQTIMAIRQSALDITLDIHPQSGSKDIRFAAPLIEHLLDKWNSVWTQTQVSGALSWRPWSGLIAEIKAVNQTGSESTFEVPYLPETSSLYPKFGVAFQTLEISQNLGQKDIELLDTILVDQASNLTKLSLVQHDSDAGKLRTLLEERIARASLDSKIELVHNLGYGGRRGWR